MTKTVAPLHPGEVLHEKYLKPLGMSAGALAKVCGVPRTRIERIAAGEADITADTALRLAKALGTSPDVWLNLQNDYDVQAAKLEIGKALSKIEQVTVAAPVVSRHPLF
jgi:addiction module HigA family antidote